MSDFLCKIDHMGDLAKNWVCGKDLKADVIQQRFFKMRQTCAWFDIRYQHSWFSIFCDYICYLHTVLQMLLNGYS